ncbi:MAG: aminoglycoside phosphotransferase family protein [Deltaproteobacteria bacterium]|nr:aminoglycoside phosphotransferase family protein [Deltaproteobacteria bacterium]
MTRLPQDSPLYLALRRLLASAGDLPPAGEATRQSLPSSREVCRFTFSGNGAAVVGKFSSAYPAAAPADKGLAREYGNYLRAADLGLTDGSVRIPRLLGRQPDLRLGLLLGAVSGPDLDCLIRGACEHGEMPGLRRGLESLAELFAFFHSRALSEAAVSGLEALRYLDKLMQQLQGVGLLTADDQAALAAERSYWEIRLAQFSDRQVLVHGDATPTNFLFPDHGGPPPRGRAVALDLERLRFADRLWDLSWVAGELRHAWAWRTGNAAAAEEIIGLFFSAYLSVSPEGSSLAERLYLLNPLYMALAELRIARNTYLSWDYRRWLVGEARRCLNFGRRL